MSKEKQIEEMENDLANREWCKHLQTELCDNRNCTLCEAEILYEAGYRKQSEGEWIVTDADSGSFGEYEPFIEFKCPKCESDYGIESGQYGWQYGEPIPWVSCPLCGARMKGGAE